MCIHIYIYTHRYVYIYIYIYMPQRQTSPLATWARSRERAARTSGAFRRTKKPSPAVIRSRFTVPRRGLRKGGSDQETPKGHS